jgi:hypothetical protein
MKFFGMLLLAFTVATTANAQDVLLQKNLTVTTDQFDLVLQRTEGNIKAFVDNFNIKLASGSKVTSPKVVTGTLLQPVLKVSVKKCVFIICNTIALDAEFTLKKGAATAACDVTYVLAGDLRRSSSLLVNNYSDLNTNICIKKSATGAVAALNVYLVRSPRFSGDTVQSETLKFFKLQSTSVIESFTKVLMLNGAKQIN